MLVSLCLLFFTSVSSIYNMRTNFYVMLVKYIRLASVARSLSLFCSTRVVQENYNGCTWQSDFRVNIAYCEWITDGFKMADTVRSSRCRPFGTTLQETPNGTSRTAMARRKPPLMCGTPLFKVCGVSLSLKLQGAVSSIPVYQDPLFWETCCLLQPVIIHQRFLDLIY